MLAALNPFIRYANAINTSRYHADGCMGLDHRLFCCTRGRMHITCGEITRELIPGTLVFIPAYTPYSIHSLSDGEETQLIAFDFDLTSANAGVCESLRTHKAADWDGVRSHTEEIPAEFSSPIAIPDMTEGMHEMRRIVQLFIECRPYWRESASAILKGILLTMLTREQARALPDLARALMDYVRENYASPDTNAAIARRFHYHPYHLSRVMRDATGMTLREYILACRIRAAKSELASTGDSITAIAQRCGFTDSAYFSKVFLRSEGVTPSAYRKRMTGHIL